jgi:hypothetical protein
MPAEQDSEFTPHGVRACDNEMQVARWAAPCTPLTFWDFINMSYRHWELDDSNHRNLRGQATNGAVSDEHKAQPADSALDAALRSVPLPDGLLTRLDKFVLAITAESSDAVDWLGC